MKLASEPLASLTRKEVFGFEKVPEKVAVREAHSVIRPRRV